MKIDIFICGIDLITSLYSSLAQLFATFKTYCLVSFSVAKATLESQMSVCQSVSLSVCLSHNYWPSCLSAIMPVQPSDLCHAFAAFKPFWLVLTVFSWVLDLAILAIALPTIYIKGQFLVCSIWIVSGKTW